MLSALEKKNKPPGVGVQDCHLGKFGSPISSVKQLRKGKRAESANHS